MRKLQPSFFEMCVALAYNYFAEQRVDIAVVEVGLGGAPGLYHRYLQSSGFAITSVLAECEEEGNRGASSRSDSATD